MTRTLTSDAITQAAELLDAQFAFALCRFPGEQEPTLFPHLIAGDLPEHYFVVRPWNSTSPNCYFGKESSANGSFTPVKRMVEEVAQTSFNDYSDQFDKIQSLFRESNLEKVILSRTILHLESLTIDVLDAFRKLAERYPEAMVFLINHPTEGLWIGASPELLLQYSATKFETISLAGTKSASHPSDWNTKEYEEHRYVSEHIREVALQFNGTDLVEKGPYTVNAGPVNHLRTDFSFELSREKIATPKILSALHPTPAIAGWPVDKALEAIAEIENHERKLYCGYIGEVKGDQGKFYVNLRSAEIGDKLLICHSGGGITAQSDKMREWEETRLKAETLISVIANGR